MAKQHNNNPDPSEVVIFFARARGGGAVVADSVRALADAVERASQPRLPARIVKALPLDGKREEKTLFDQVDDQEASDAPEAAEEITETPGSADQRRKRGDGDPKDRNTGIALVGDINFVPSGEQSLKEFFATKAPATDMDQILVLCHYLQHTLSQPKIGPGHILSGFRHVGKPVPKDLKQTIRNMRKKAWLSFTDIDEIRLTTEGENRVTHELGKDGGAAE